MKRATALRAGAEDFVSKPVLNEELLHRIAQLERIGELRRLALQAMRALERKVRVPGHAEEVLGVLKSLKGA